MAFLWAAGWLLLFSLAVPGPALATPLAADAVVGVNSASTDRSLENNLVSTAAVTKAAAAPAATAAADAGVLSASFLSSGRRRRWSAVPLVQTAPAVEYTEAVSGEALEPFFEP
jgi:hypothetical protein